MHVSRTFAPILASLIAVAGGCDRLRPHAPYVGRWERAASSPITRAEAPGAVVEGRLYVFGGFDSAALTVSPRVDAYDPKTGAWSRHRDLPLELTHVVPAVDGRIVWFAGGFEGRHPGTAVADVIAYDAAADTWSQGPALPAARAGGALVRRGRSLHFFGGFVDRNATSGDHWVLDLDDPAPAWRERAPLPEPRGHHGGAVVGDRIFAIGGQFNHDDARRDVDFVHAYDAEGDRWSAVAPLPTPRSHFDTATVVVDGKIVVFGGRNESPRPFWARPHPLSDSALRNVTLYDPERNVWSERPQLPMGLVSPTAGVIGDRIVIVGGSVHLAAFPQDDTYVASSAALLGD
jgi:N-acetylneuraminic acid mutarotase